MYTLSAAPPTQLLSADYCTRLTLSKAHIDICTEKIRAYASQVPQPTCYWTFKSVGEPDYPFGGPGSPWRARRTRFGHYCHWLLRLCWTHGYHTLWTNIGPLLYGMVFYLILLYGFTLNFISFDCIAMYCMTFHCIVSHGMVLYCI